MNPHYELPCPSPHSFLIFSHAPPPPQRRSFFLGDPPPSKRDIIVIKPDMHIFCSVQYDLYFLFTVKLLTTHSTDVAATFVNSKNTFCPFAKALLHYFSKSKSQFPIFRLWIFQSVSFAGLSTSSSSSIKARMKSSSPELMELKTCKR